GIRDGHVTGVQTCALPILWTRHGKLATSYPPNSHSIMLLDFLAIILLSTRPVFRPSAQAGENKTQTIAPAKPRNLEDEITQTTRSEERCVGKECRKQRRTI